MTDTRAQSTVVGVALLLAASVVAIAAMTATFGALVDRRADAATTGRVVAGFSGALDPHTVGPGRERVPTPDGGVRVVDREVRLLRGDRAAVTLDANGLRYESGRRRATYLAGGVTRNGRIARDPSVGLSGDTLVVGVAVLGAEPGRSVSADGVLVRTNVTHERRRFDAGAYRLAVETSAPDGWETAAPAGTTTDRVDIDGDGVPSVVVDVPGETEVVLTVHRLDAEVTAS